MYRYMYMYSCTTHSCFSDRLRFNPPRKSHLEPECIFSPMGCACSAPAEAAAPEKDTAIVGGRCAPERASDGKEAAVEPAAKVYEPTATQPVIMKNYAPNVYPSPPVVKPVVAAAADALTAQAQTLASPPAPAQRTSSEPDVASETVRAAVGAALSKVEAGNEEEEARQAVAHSVTTTAVAAAVQQVEPDAALMAAETTPKEAETAEPPAEQHFLARISTWFSRSLSSFVGSTDVVEIEATPAVVQPVSAVDAKGKPTGMEADNTRIIQEQMHQVRSERLAWEIAPIRLPV